MDGRRAAGEKPSPEYPKERTPPRYALSDPIIASNPRLAGVSSVLQTSQLLFDEG
jgi:hypothetical protein